VDFPSAAGLIGAGAREGARRLPILARAFEIFRGRARLGLGLSFEKFLFEVVFREQGILIESKLTQAAFRLSQFKVFLGAAKNAGTELWYIFLKAPSKEFADELAALGRAEGVRVRIFSFNP